MTTLFLASLTSTNGCSALTSWWRIWRHARFVLILDLYSFSYLKTSPPSRASRLFGKWHWKLLWILPKTPQACISIFIHKRARCWPTRRTTRGSKSRRVRRADVMYYASQPSESMTWLWTSRLQNTAERQLDLENNGLDLNKSYRGIIVNPKAAGNKSCIKNVDRKDSIIPWKGNCLVAIPILGLKGATKTYIKRSIIPNDSYIALNVSLHHELPTTA